MTLDYMGFIGGLLVSVALFPQIIKAWTTKSTKDISILWNLILAIGLFLWIIYGIANMLMPIIIFTTIEMLLTVSLLVLKLIYK